jgi:hypothetical protein
MTPPIHDRPSIGAVTNFLNVTEEFARAYAHNLRPPEKWTRPDVEYAIGRFIAYADALFEPRPKHTRRKLWLAGRLWILRKLVDTATKLEQWSATPSYWRARALEEMR